MDYDDGFHSHSNSNSEENSILKALHYAVGNICREEESAEQNQATAIRIGSSSSTTTVMSREAIEALTQMTYHYATTCLAQDLASFCRHGNRKTIKVDDVMLVARKNPGGFLLDSLASFRENGTGNAAGINNGTTNREQDYERNQMFSFSRRNGTKGRDKQHESKSVSSKKRSRSRSRSRNISTSNGNKSASGKNARSSTPTRLYDDYSDDDFDNNDDGDDDDDDALAPIANFGKNIGSQSKSASTVSAKEGKIRAQSFSSDNSLGISLSVSSKSSSSSSDDSDDSSKSKSNKSISTQQRLNNNQHRAKQNQNSKANEKNGSNASRSREEGKMNTDSSSGDELESGGNHIGANKGVQQLKRIQKAIEIELSDDSDD